MKTEDIVIYVTSILLLGFYAITDLEIFLYVFNSIILLITTVLSIALLGVLFDNKELIKNIYEIPSNIVIVWDIVYIVGVISFLYYFNLTNSLKLFIFLVGACITLLYIRKLK